MNKYIHIALMTAAALLVGNPVSAQSKAKGKQKSEEVRANKGPEKGKPAKEVQDSSAMVQDEKGKPEKVGKGKRGEVTKDSSVQKQRISKAEHPGRHLGQNKGELKGRDFGQYTAEQARNKVKDRSKMTAEQADSAKQQATELERKAEEAQRKAEEQHDQGTLSDEEYQARVEILEKIKDRIKGSQSKIEVIKDQMKKAEEASGAGTSEEPDPVPSTPERPGTKTTEPVDTK